MISVGFFGDSFVTNEIGVTAEKAPPPSHQQQKNFKFYRHEAVSDASASVACSNSALAINLADPVVIRRAKLVLEQYCAAKALQGLPGTMRYSEQRAMGGKRPLLSSDDFICEVDLAACAALKKAPALQKAFQVLFVEEEGRRVDGYAKAAPKSLRLMLKLVAAELNKRGLKSIQDFFRVVTR